jgi:hypothetical protein
MFDTIRGTISEDERQLNFFSVWMLAQVSMSVEKISSSPKHFRPASSRRV